MGEGTPARAEKAHPPPCLPNGEAGGCECTLFKNPFKTWEALTERKRGMRMGFSRITAEVGST